MGNQNTSPFKKLKKLLVPLDLSQCVLYKHELLICGGHERNNCYSYHTHKNEYKLICKYPSNVKLQGHCVIKLKDNKNDKDNNEITLLSFGGKDKHTLVMKYVSVWSDDNDISEKSSHDNEWIPFKDNRGKQINIGRDGDNYIGMRALIGGSENNLLFITCQPKDICVFDLNKFRFIKHETLPTKNDCIYYSCFVAKSENMTKTNNNNNNNNKKSEMLLFYKKTGLRIEYDEDNNTFQFPELTVCESIESFLGYAYVYINDVILFFGGWNGKFGSGAIVSRSVHKYSIREDKWTTFENALPKPLCGCVGILNDDNKYVHIIGGDNQRLVTVSEHLKAQVSEWLNEERKEEKKEENGKQDIHV
ncbi:hypothetical protein RFI_32744 [Reticulomyxa filosa]|uniref:Uncharacterized protein n=1 Tax=Reticulomyxa filosa TaxID=46433 RepID=X6LU34_RETFI|nr:hypothetical protein RFI_32744 [Reticulomyxa filosa]|eukprot:ETO04652.1 hypothetical protein RFI_32744 [Reticulomyxa filosa]